MGPLERRGEAGIAAVVVVLVATSAWAGGIPPGRDVRVVHAPPRPLVAVVKPPEADGACQEIVTRIIAELMADGIPVVALSCLPEDSACLNPGGIRVSAVVTVRWRENDPAVEVRTAEASVLLSAPPPGLVAAGSPVGAGSFVGGGDAGAGPAALAVRTVEFLRATALDGPGLALGTGPAGAVVQKADGDQEAPPDDRNDTAVADHAGLAPVGPRKLTVGVGAVLLAGTSGLEHAYAPSLSLGRRTSEHVMLSLVIAGPSFGRAQHQGGSRVAVRHEMAALQVDLLGLFWRVVVLRAGMGAGVYHVHVDADTRTEVAGQPGTTFVTGSKDGFAGLLCWSAGMVVNVRRDLGLFLETRMFVLTPTPAILLSGLEIGRVGNPGLALSSGMELRF